MDAPAQIIGPNALVIGVIVSALIVIAAIMVGRRRGKRTSGFWKLYANPLYIVTAVIIILAFILAQSQGFALLEKPYSFGSIVTRFFDSVHDTFQTISLDGNPRIGSENLLPVGWPPILAWVYLVYQSLIFILAPATAFSSLAFMFFTLLSTPALSWRSRNHDAYVFSELNSSSLTLAKSIIAHDKAMRERYEASKKDKGAGSGKAIEEPKGSVIAFSETDNADEALVDEARTLGTICSDRSIVELASRCSKSSKRFFIFSSLNEAQNLRESLKLTDVLIDEGDTADKPNVIVFSTSSLSDGYADSAGRRCSGAVTFRRFDHVQNTINQVLMEMPVFLNVLPSEANSQEGKDRLYSSDKRRLLIIGSGNMGSAFLKGAIWSSQSNSINTHIDVVDIAAMKAKRRLAMECPEIARMIGKRNSDNPHAEAYDIEFHAFDVYSARFEKYLQDHGNEASYVFIALGDDLVTARAARRVRELLERSRVSSGSSAAVRPPIVAVIDDSTVSASVADATSPKGQSYNITTIGSTEALFSYENVFQPRLEECAMRLNAAYWGYFDQDESSRAETLEGANNSYNKFEYNRISSRASAIFLKHHLFEFCRRVASRPIDNAGKKLPLPSAGDWTLPLSSPAFKAPLDAYTAYVNSGIDRGPLQELEHRRWNAFMRTLGYECCSEDALKAINEPLQDKMQVDHLSRLHICLVPFDDLEKADAMFERVAGKNPHYKLADDAIIVHLQEIVGNE
ncbi:MAG: hypothetical protein Q4D39_00100 [Coriobacteriaceae bacterium]|nr:hypothetical protein [Coriobacteriaceae bacterium]